MFKNLKNLLFIALYLFLTNEIHAQSKRKSLSPFTVQGIVNDVNDSSIVAFYCKGNDTVVGKYKLPSNHKIFFKGYVNEPTKVYLDERGIVYNISTKTWDSKISFWVEPGKVTQFSYDSVGRVTAAKGNNSQKEQNEFDALFQKTLIAQQNIIKRGRVAKDNGTFSEMKPVLDKEWDSIEVSKRRIIVKFIKQHKSSFAALSLFKDYMYCFKAYNKADSLIKVFEVVDNNVKTSESGRRIQELLGLEGKIKIGTQIPEITEKDTSGNSFKLSSLKGKYVLIDFWASWCVPCRQQIPQLKQIYGKYKDRSFTIVSISIDDDRLKWVNAINHEGIDWFNISDLKGSNGSWAKVFNVHEIPKLYLIGPQGEVVFKDLSIGEVGSKLETILGK